MTPEERELLTRFLNDLTQARAGPKDPEAASLISQAINSNPDAPYLLVQHTVISDEALRAAQARIAELEAQLANAGRGEQRSFLGGGSFRQGQGSTAVPPTGRGQPDYGPGPQSGYAPAGGPFSSGGGLGSFLRSAGTTAAGVAGGEMLFQGLSGLFGGHRGLFGGGGYGYGAPIEETVVNNYYDDNGPGDVGGGWDDGGGYDDGSSF